MKQKRKHIFQQVIGKENKIYLEDIITGKFYDPRKNMWLTSKQEKELLY